MGYSGGSVVKYPPANAGDTGNGGSIPGLGRSPGEGHTTHSSILTWRIPWTEEPGGATVHRVTKSRTRLKWLSTHILLLIHEHMSKYQNTPILGKCSVRDTKDVIPTDLCIRVAQRKTGSFQREDSGTVNSPGLSISDFSEHSEFPHILCEMIVEREQEICLRSLPCKCGK